MTRLTTTQEIARFVSLASDELLWEIVESTAKKWAFIKFHALTELRARRDAE